MGALTHSGSSTVQKRRSDRIFIRIPLSIRGTDQNGQDFRNRAVTQMVARFGASIITKLTLYPEQELLLVPSEKNAMRVRVIGQTSIGPDGHVYGIAFLNSTSDLWGIHFPPLPEAVVDSTPLECCTCHACESVRLSELESEVLHANNALRRPCSHCGDMTTWQLAPHPPVRKPPRLARELRPDEQAGLPPRSETPPPAATAPEPRPPQPQRRMHPRVRVNVKACLAQPGVDDDVVSAINMSRGGVLVRSERVYPMESWIQLAVPYTPAASNIFVPARIVRCDQVEGVYQYGIKYVRC